MFVVRAVGVVYGKSSYRNVEDKQLLSNIIKDVIKSCRVNLNFFMLKS